MFNLPADERDVDLGTTLYARKDGSYAFDNGEHHTFDEFDLRVKAAFHPNSAIGFLNFGEAYHGVEPIERPVERWNLQYTIRIK